MPSVTYDKQSFLVDGRRVWLVSGAIHYPRVPRELWRDRIRAAKQAGLNCIETYCFWNAHEPEPKRFDFKGNLDLRAFVQMIGEEGMWCILRPGPYVCAEWDNGGLPAWLWRVDTPKDTEMKLRQSSPPFLEASSRYLSAVMEQVKDLQVTTAPPSRVPRPTAANFSGEAAGGFQSDQAGGPIILVQAENEWFCGNPEQGTDYLGELVRYLRENGCKVPVTVCNQLWQTVDGTIHTWNGKRHLPTDLRQLAVVQPDAPRLVTEYWPGWFDAWGGEHATEPVDLHLKRMAGICAAGAMINQFMFHGGTNFGFWGGRTVGGRSVHMTTSYDYDAPLLEAGGRGAKYAVTKRLCTFVSQFGQVFAGLSAGRPHAAVLPSEGGHPPSVIHLPGSAGEVILILRGKGDATERVDLMLSEGLTLPVSLGDEPVSWVLLNTNLGGSSVLDYTNVRPWAYTQEPGGTGQMLVLFGPAGSEGIISLDQVPLQVHVPEGRDPVVEAHEGITIVVISTEQVDQAYLFAKGLAVNADGLDAEGTPLPARGSDPMVTVGFDGAVATDGTAAPRKPTSPPITDWAYADPTDLLDGTSAAYEPIDGPVSHDLLGCDRGYGWYRIGVGKGSARATKVFAPGAGDRLHVFENGEPVGLVGVGPGAEPQPATLRLTGDVVVLCDNLGRFNYGMHVGEQKGLPHHVYEVKPVKLPKPGTSSDPAPSIKAAVEYASSHRVHERPAGPTLTWELRPASKARPLIVEIHDLPTAAIVMLNREAIDFYAGHSSANYLQLLLDPEDERVSTGKNVFGLALMRPLEAGVDPLKHVSVWQAGTNLTSRGQWAFTPWAPPEADAFEPLPSARANGGDAGGRPRWYRGTFKGRDTDVPTFLEPRGMTKGQIYVNGHNVGRYFVSTADGESVTPQTRYYLPQPWINAEGDNELLIFDEHGARPDKCRLVFEPLGPYS